jgi:endonuclease III
VGSIRRIRVHSCCLGEVGRALRELQGEERGGEALQRFGSLLYHAFHFQGAGEPLLLLETDAARTLVEASPPRGGAWSGGLPADAGYLQLPRHLFWSGAVADDPAEPIDGFFWTRSSGNNVAFLVTMGLREDRPGFSVMELPPLPVADGARWGLESARVEGGDFTTELPGGELDRLYSLLTAGEVLKLAARTFGYLDAVPEALGAEEQPPRPDAVESSDGRVAPSFLPFRRIPIGSVGWGRRRTGVEGGRGMTEPTPGSGGRAGGRESKADRRARAETVFDLLHLAYPDAHCALDHENAFQLTAATILSAQCTDERVNQVTPELFRAFPDPERLSAAPQEVVEGIIHSTGFFRNKAKSLIGMARALMDKHGGEVPSTMQELVRLPGVGRKTANVVLGNAFGLDEGVVVDTHVARLSKRLRFTRETDPVKIEQALIGLFPRERWTLLAHLLIFHGRAVCVARNPRCESCVLAPHCPSARI